MPRAERKREEGWLVVEAVLALTVLTIGVLGFLFSFQSNFRATKEIGDRDLAQVALESAAETLRTADFKTLYATYQGSSLPCPGLRGPSGGPAVVRVQFHVDETKMPIEYGPVTDIDEDGIMATTDSSASYVLLPTRFALTYQTSYGLETRVMFVVLGD